MSKCRVCGVELNDENWYASSRKRRDYSCKECRCERSRLWREANPGASLRWYHANPEKGKAFYTKSKRNQGELPYNENKECTLYLGVHIAERVLSYVFKDVERMPMNHPGYDFICNRGKMIDVKSACLSGTKYPHWTFLIKHNTTADFFLCLAFDNRENLNPLHVWLLPGNVVNHTPRIEISPSTVSRWDEYKLDISKISDCCDTMREK